MIVAIYDTDSGDYAIIPEEDFLSCSLKIEVTQEFMDRYLACEVEKEFIQSRLHEYYREAAAQQQLKRTKSPYAIQPLGF